MIFKIFSPCAFLKENSVNAFCLWSRGSIENSSSLYFYKVGLRSAINETQYVLFVVAFVLE